MPRFPPPRVSRLTGGEQAEAEEAVTMLELECKVLTAAFAEHQAAAASMQGD
jgi:hypothetical protein